MYKIIAHDGDHHVLGQNEYGDKLNFNISNILNRLIKKDLRYDSPVSEPNQPEVNIARLHTFKKGQKIRSHDHMQGGLHDIRVIAGQALIIKGGENIIGNVGDIIDLKIDEEHSIEALIDGTVTLHVIQNV